ncbi:MULTISPECIES: RNA recognition motif domain-containing protein [Ktedonobacter]|uniref:RNP-1 like RNA-binding protein n=2 Tax=Ktedonobacter TaxID=363276 RepID=D6U1T5_KTERA|nr:MULTISPECIES: RNA-binding protein [Ktedonobacter]EFH80819.1 RNP-1 like RNA-binding protein [Ktedonobacter racemifer DSM 44963]GHO60774.1 RNA-binding protein [Ktedonobacter robiniae]
MRLYVGNLSYRITDQELGDFFAQIGRVQRVRVVTERETGRSKGFGFVDMLNEQDARAAIEQLNGKRLGGRALTVAEARERPESPERWPISTREQAR